MEAKIEHYSLWKSGAGWKAQFRLQFEAEEKKIHLGILSCIVVFFSLFLWGRSMARAFTETIALYSVNRNSAFCWRSDYVCRCIECDFSNASLNLSCFYGFISRRKSRES